MEVRDNGSAVGETTRSGLGTRLLIECTLEWSRTRVGGGQLLAALVPATSAYAPAAATD
jgi:hypothetical protein